MVPSGSRDRSSFAAMSEHKVHPVSLVMSHGYKSALSESAINCPIFQTSTFVFSSAEDDKTSFEVAFVLREKGEKEEPGLFYNTLNNLNLLAIDKEQCLWADPMVSFSVHGGEAEAFRFHNALKLMKLAVSMGSSGSLAEHPASMTHAGLDTDERAKLGISANLVRLSVGLEHTSDLIADKYPALNAI